MSVYLNMDEIKEIVNQFQSHKAKFAHERGYNHYYICLYNSLNTGSLFISFKKRSGNLYKIWRFKDDFRFYSGFWEVNYNGSNYGKPKTKDEFKLRLKKFTENLHKMDLKVKKYKQNKKLEQINNDF